MDDRARQRHARTNSDKGAEMVWFWLALVLALGLLAWRAGRKGTRRRSDPGVGYHAQHHSKPSEFLGGGGN